MCAYYVHLGNKAVNVVVSILLSLVGAALSREVRALPVDWSHPGSQLELHLSLLHLAAGRPGRRLRHR